jgi:hypothetical protein
LNNNSTKFKIKGTETIKESEFELVRANEAFRMPPIECKLFIIKNINDTITILNDSIKQPSLSIPLNVSFQKPKIIIEPSGAIFFGIVQKNCEIVRDLSISNNQW